MEEKKTIEAKLQDRLKELETENNSLKQENDDKVSLLTPATKILESVQ